MKDTKALIDKLESNRAELNSIRNGLINSHMNNQNGRLKPAIKDRLVRIGNSVTNLLSTDADKLTQDDFENLSSQQIISIGKTSLMEMQKNRSTEINQDNAIKAFAFEFEKGNPDGGYHLGLLYRDYLTEPERACNIFRGLHSACHLKSTLELIITLQCISSENKEKVHLALEAEQLKQQLNLEDE